MSLSNRIQELREKQNLSQEQLAEKLGISRQAVSKWESELSKPDIENIIRLSEIFSVSTDYLLTGNNHEAECTVTKTKEKPSIDVFKIIKRILFVVFMGTLILLLTAIAFYIFSQNSFVK